MINLLNSSSNPIILGRRTDNEYTSIQFSVPSAWLTLPGAAVNLKFKRPDGLVYLVAQGITTETFEWKPTITDVAIVGSGSIQGFVTGNNGVVNNGPIISTYTMTSLGSSGDPPVPAVPDWTVEVAQNASNASNSAIAAAQSESKVLESANAASASALDALTSKNESIASAAAALESKVAAGVSETNSASSKESAQQALADLLAMLGTDIPTMVGGKIPMSQIPATATQEIYVVSSEMDLAGLTAQYGDLAELVERIDNVQTITKTWQLLGDNPAIFTNWVVWGTSYAVQAGSASFAEEADNAYMINDHRMVEMTAAEFESAVKDDNTYYLVYSEASS